MIYMWKSISNLTTLDAESKKQLSQHTQAITQALMTLPIHIDQLLRVYRV